MSKQWINKKAKLDSASIFEGTNQTPEISDVYCLQQNCNEKAEKATKYVSFSDADLSANTFINSYLVTDNADDIDLDRHTFDTSPQNNLSDDLLVFSMMYSLPNKGLQFLLDILNKHKVEVPKSVYLLKKTCNVVSVDDYCVSDEFAYLSLKENLEFAIEKGVVSSSDLITVQDKHFIDIQINIDGLPLFKSSQLGLWPILVKFTNHSYPYPVAVYCGVGKPNLCDFVGKLVSELKIFKESGLNVCNQILFLRNVVFVCDAPARAFLQCIKGHGGFFGCGYCRQEGQYVHDRVVFPSLEFDLRDDQSYRNFKENNQHSLSPLASVVPLHHGLL